MSEMSCMDWSSGCKEDSNFTCFNWTSSGVKLEKVLIKTEREEYAETPTEIANGIQVPGETCIENDGKAIFEKQDVKIEVEGLKEEPPETLIEYDKEATDSQVVELKEEFLNQEMMEAFIENISPVLDIEVQAFLGIEAGVESEEKLKQQVTDSLIQSGFMGHISQEMVQWIVDTLRGGRLPTEEDLSSAFQAANKSELSEPKTEDRDMLTSDVPPSSHAKAVEKEEPVHNKDVCSESGDLTRGVVGNKSPSGTAVKTETLEKSEGETSRCLGDADILSSDKDMSSVHICSICNQELLTAALLTKHLADSHIDKANPKCPVCNKLLCSIGSLKQHLPVHTGEKSHVCSECGKAFNHAKSLMTHFMIHTGEKPYQCSACGKGFIHKSHFQRHEFKHWNEKLQCYVCEKKFNDVQSLQSHRRSHFVCSVCDKGYPNLENLRKHMVYHEDSPSDTIKKTKVSGKYKCSLCKKSFYHSSHIRRHMKTHTGEKPFKCSECDKSFATSHDRKVHERIHKGEYPYKCSFCDKKSRTNSEHNKHMKKFHSR